MGRPLASAGLLRLLGAAGTVAAAAVAHTAAGGTPPSPVLCLGAIAVVTGLAALAGRLPARLRTMRLRLAAAVALQPVLHVTFLLRAPADQHPAGVRTVPVMMLAHLLAAGVAAWWIARGAARLIEAAERLSARMAPVRPRPPSATAGVLVPATDAASRPRIRVLGTSLVRRGPPGAAGPLPSPTV